MPSREPDARVISIGTLAAHPLRHEAPNTRTGHATTTLVRAGDRAILIDPGLPAEALVPRLAERTGLRPSQITDVFLTSFHPDCRRALPAFESARWLIAAPEREGVGVPMAALLRASESDPDADDALDPDARDALLRDVAILQRCQPAPDALAPGVSLFPLPGVTPGLTGVLIAGSRHTTLICGDAIPTPEHLEEGKILPRATDLDQAKESMVEAIEIADLLILGRDNLVVNPTKRAF